MGLVIEYHEEIEHDLLPDIDLLDFWRGVLSARRLEMLVRRLPASSAFIKAHSPDAAAIAAWGPTEYVLADLLDITMHAHFKKPQPYPRPADAVRKQRETDARHQKLIERHLARQQARERGSRG